MTFIIAEAGVNHNGKFETAIELVDAAKSAGADIVKFQTFNAKKMVTVDAEKAEYQIKNEKKFRTQLEMLKSLELSKLEFGGIVSHCKKCNIEFLSTAFDEESLAFLVNELDLKTLKIGSGELTNTPFVYSHAVKRKNLIVSTGMSFLSDVELALGAIAHGLINSKDTFPDLDKFRKAYSSKIGQEAIREKVTLLHCTTEYPTQFADVNLRCMDTLKNTFGNINVGYSDHTAGIEVAIAAAARGATIIEKHITLDTNMDGPDHSSSLEPLEFNNMVLSIRNVDNSLGSAVKYPSEKEFKNIRNARKSLVAKGFIKKGDQFNLDNLTAKRPGNGRNPSEYWSLINTNSKRFYKPGDLIVD
jgi:N-acetylneuraminate synthase